MLGGYPIGAKMLSDLNGKDPAYKEHIKKALPYFVNAGPAFIVIAVGKGILKSVKIGYMLLAAHCIASIICALIFIPRIIIMNRKNDNEISGISAADNFVLSVKNASGAVLSICSYVVIFSVINKYLISFCGSFGAIKPLIYVTEITTAVNSTKNIYLISFLLGFSGFSVIAQVYSVAGNVKAPLFKFIAVRTMHGILSAILMKVFLNLFNVTVTAMSAGTNGINTPAVNDGALGFSLAIMALLFIINVSSKKFSGNIVKDVL